MCHECEYPKYIVDGSCELNCPNTYEEKSTADKPRNCEFIKVGDDSIFSSAIFWVFMILAFLLCCACGFYFHRREVKREEAEFFEDY
jgi:hypothetical protein